MTLKNNVSHESGNKTTVSIQFINLFQFYTKIKTSILLRFGIEHSLLKIQPYTYIDCMSHFPHYC